MKFSLKSLSSFVSILTRYSFASVAAQEIDEPLPLAAGAAAAGHADLVVGARIPSGQSGGNVSELLLHAEGLPEEGHAGRGQTDRDPPLQGEGKPSVGRAEDEVEDVARHGEVQALFRSLHDD